MSSGNKGDLLFADYLEYLEQDEKTDVILGYVEGIREGRRFLEVATRITKKKPIVIVKAGRSDIGARAARSHSAALAGSNEILDAAFRQCGVLRVDELTEMAVMAADALRKEGLELPHLSASTMDTINTLLSQRWSRDNPVDPAGNFVSYHILWPLIEDENFDSVVIIGGVAMTSSFAGWAGIPPSMRYDAERLRRGMERAEVGNLDKTIEMMKKHMKPVIFVTMIWGARRRGRIFRKLRQSYLEPYDTTEKAARVLARLVAYSEYRGVARRG